MTYPFTIIENDDASFIIVMVDEDEGTLQQDANGELILAWDEPFASREAAEQALESFYQQNRTPAYENGWTA